MTHNLKHKAINAAGWRMAEMLCQQGGGLVVSIVLARLLLPEQFGTVALLSIFIQLANVVVNAGFGQALIQRQNTTLLEESSVFYCNIVMALLLYGVLYLVAPWVSVFYAKPELWVLCPLLRVSALSLIIGSLGQVQTNLLQKELKFKPLFLASLVTLLAQSVTGITLAIQGYGVWALAYSGIVAGLVRVLLINGVSHWRPVLKFSIRALAPLFGFGWKLLISSLLDTFYMQMYGLLIGRFYTPADLAFFNRGKSWPNILTMSLNGTITSVLFPALSRIQDDHERMRRAIKKSLQMVTFLLWPCLIGMALTAEPLVRLILTDKWLPAVPYMQVICLTMCLYPVHSINLQILSATGRSDLFLKLEVLKKVMLSVMLVLTLPHGIMAMVYGQLILSFFALLINTHYTKKIIGYSFWDQLCAVRPVVGALLGMAAGVYLMRGVSLPISTLLVLQILLGGLIYLLLAHCFKNAAYVELREMAFKRLSIFNRE